MTIPDENKDDIPDGYDNSRWPPATVCLNVCKNLKNTTNILKGQSHEKVFEFLTWDVSFGLN
jgi:hypothetical protein